NSRLYSTLTSLVARIYQMLVHKEQIVKYVDDIKDGISSNDAKLSFESVDSVRVENLSLTLSDSIIFSGISFNVKGGSLVGVLGNVGSGKSSLLYTLAGIIKTYSGKVLINDVNFSELSDFFIRSKVSYYGPDTALISGTLMDNFRFHGINKNSDIVKILKFSCPRLPISYEILEIMSVSDLPISNGEKQKMLLLMILNKKPGLIFLDEPTSFLSQSESSEMLKFIRFTNPQSIIFLATHDLSLRPLFTHVISMDNATK
ncbi:ATP-binding cassette domain-containing protein, partial [Vibrio metoecus]|uniref:ATP-binding cassette domain-containing protein n=1 Tax=Vibrio metoecus TaxID=1481663 RepID=UPI00215CE681